MALALQDGEDLLVDEVQLFIIIQDAPGLPDKVLGVRKAVGGGVRCIGVDLQPSGIQQGHAIHRGVQRLTVQLPCLMGTHVYPPRPMNGYQRYPVPAAAPS